MAHHLNLAFVQVLIVRKDAQLSVLALRHAPSALHHHSSDSTLWQCPYGIGDSAVPHITTAQSVIRKLSGLPTIEGTVLHPSFYPPPIGDSAEVPLPRIAYHALALAMSVPSNVVFPALVDHLELTWLTIEEATNPRMSRPTLCWAAQALQTVHMAKK